MHKNTFSWLIVKNCRSNPSLDIFFCLWKVTCLFLTFFTMLLKNMIVSRSPTNPLFSQEPATPPPSCGTSGRGCASRRSRVTSRTSTPWRSSPTGTRSPPAATTPPAGCSTSAPIRSWPCTVTTTSYAASPAWRSASRAGCCWPATMISTATCGTPWRRRGPVGLRGITFPSLFM